MPRERNLSRHSLAQGNARALHLGRVADLEPHAQLVCALIQKKNGKDAVGNEGANQFRGAAEQGLQVERGIERVGQAHQIRHIRRLDTGIDGIQMRGLRWAVIALEIVPCRWGWRRFAHKGSKGMITQQGSSKFTVRSSSKARHEFFAGGSDLRTMNYELSTMNCELFSIRAKFPQNRYRRRTPNAVGAGLE